MTVSQKWRRALVAGVTVSAVVLAGCSVGDGATGGAESSEGPAGSNAGDAGDVEGVRDDGDGGNELISERDLDGAPEGFRPTRPGTELDFGDAAYVVSQRPVDDDSAAPGPLQFWKVTATGSDTLDADEVPLTEGSDDVEEFVCLTYTLAFLGGGATADDRDSATVAAPELVPADDEGTGANVIERADPGTCGVDEQDLLPSSLADIDEDATYGAAVLSYVDKQKTRGINPTGLAFTYDLADTPESPDESEPTEIEPIRWN
ncbi:hypothetical protein BJF89_03210 [Corynebacterium sp. CNJ-954]|uniref:hypothetical protein n=1 Tax=Corynebacterium sp. CNJ-954 TaxID=1904962 RepID=UPI000965945D|nr:hypothetical protein [Corynebacterium sp. CNJ-954]OLT53811.1 hypothetical protein BJF89_03210 [Corynebacterium sp. CNJ-954]